MCKLNTYYKQKDNETRFRKKEEEKGMQNGINETKLSNIRRYDNMIL